MTLEDLPCMALKRDLYHVFKPISQRDVAREATEVVMKFRNMPEEKARYVKLLRRHEVKALMVQLGF